MVLVQREAKAKQKSVNGIAPQAPVRGRKYGENQAGKV
ncbi:hypothetical protein BN135_3709 [Cronobacter muytjensii 530]